MIPHSFFEVLTAASSEIKLPPVSRAIRRHLEGSQLGRMVEQSGYCPFEMAGEIVDALREAGFVDTTIRALFTPREGE